MGLLFTLLVLAAVVTWVVRLVLGSGVRVALPLASGWRVTFRDGSVERVEGKLSRNVLHAFEDIAAHASLSGDVRLAGQDLVFSDLIPPGARQQLRNAYFAGVTVH